MSHWINIYNFCVILPSHFLCRRKNFRQEKDSFFLFVYLVPRAYHIPMVISWFGFIYIFQFLEICGLHSQWRAAMEIQYTPKMMQYVFHGFNINSCKMFHLNILVEIQLEVSIASQLYHSSYSTWFMPCHMSHMLQNDLFIFVCCFHCHWLGAMDFGNRMDLFCELVN